MNDSCQTICLVMIVRNEAQVIQRCLASVLPFIDYWVVVDTGSMDDTQEIVRECLKTIPGQLIERPWVDFGYNRTEALGYARGHGSYVLIIDADETLEVSADFHKNELTADAYLVETYYGGLSYQRKQLLRNDLPWRYEGVLHEYAVCKDAKTEQQAAGLRVHVSHAGARARDPLTYQRDALLLETALLSEPDNVRYVFYLAQSYRDAGDLELAVRNYRRRSSMGGWNEEVWYSLYQIASCHDRMEYDWGIVLQEYLAAHAYKPERAEPLFRIGMHYLRIGDVHLARLFFDPACQVPYPPGKRLFIEKDIYNYQLPMEYAIACSYTGDQEEAIAVCNRLLRSDLLAPDVIDRVLEIRRNSMQSRHQPRQSPEKQGRLKVCVFFHDPGAAFDDCIESLVLQQGNSFDVVLIDDGSRDDPAERIPINHPGFTLLRNETPVGFEASLDRFVSTQCDPDDIVFPLAWADRLANRSILQQIQVIFNDQECRLLYGQHRLPEGLLGNAEPAASEVDFLRRLSVLTSHSPIIFQAQLWQENAQQASQESQPDELAYAAEGTLRSSLTDTLMQVAGFRATYFTDNVFTILERNTTREEQLSVSVRPSALVVDHSACLPTVSCLMVTHDRLALAKRSIGCFAHQTYQNRELVIVSDGERWIRRGLERFVAEHGHENVRFVYPAQEGLTLGALRNIAMDAAAGEILCQWDDDDCYHPERIQVQVQQMLEQNGRACFLTDHLQFLEEDQALVWVDWTLGGRSGREQLLPGTVVMFKDERFRYPESGLFSQRGEDSAILYKLYDTVPVVAAKGLGYLYLYTYHGRNTFDRDHHYRLSAFGRTISALEKEKELICRAMAHYPVAKPYLAVGCDGPAFMLED